MGCELLTTSSDKTAQAIAEELDQENNKRQDIERHILSEIDRRLEADPQLLQRSLVLDQPPALAKIPGLGPAGMA
jgi:single-stranded DNA-specific DHH superfamily exonuclease